MYSSSSESFASAQIARSVGVVARAQSKLAAPRSPQRSATTVSAASVDCRSKPRMRLFRRRAQLVSGDQLQRARRRFAASALLCAGADLGHRLLVSQVEQQLAAGAFALRRL